MEQTMQKNALKKSVVKMPTSLYFNLNGWNERLAMTFEFIARNLAYFSTNVISQFFVKVVEE